MRSPARWIAVALVGAALLALSYGSGFAGAQGEGARYGTDPLTPAEAAAAVEDAGVPESAVQPESAGPEALGHNGLPERLVLLVERHLEDKGADVGLRRADVYAYSYADDTLTVSVVDLADGGVDATTSVNGDQLPLIEVEEQRAVELLLADPVFAERLAEEYQRVMGEPLSDAAQDLDVQPIVFKADAVPTVATGRAAQCGVHRCAQFLIQSTDHALINLFPLVDLSAGEVLAADGVAGS